MAVIAAANYIVNLPNLGLNQLTGKSLPSDYTFLESRMAHQFLDDILLRLVWSIKDISVFRVY